jgi:hypothetical protein
MDWWRRRVVDAGGWRVLAWQAIRGTAAPRSALFVAAAVFSHWVLDAIVHAPELPLLAGTSHRFGAGLWNNMPVALLLESTLAAAGLWLFLRGAGLPRGRAAGPGGTDPADAGVHHAGHDDRPRAAVAHAMAASSLLTIVAVCALAGWLGRSARSPERTGIESVDKTA